MNYSEQPQVLKRNRVKRLYLGGRNLDRWQMLGEGIDGYDSEEFLISTVSYIGPGRPKNRGISMADWEGREVSLDQMIREDEKGFLGTAYAGKTGGHLGILTRVGDSAHRLIIQCHPDTRFARTRLGVSFGKTESWYIADTREKEGECYAGFKEWVKPEAFKRAFLSGDSEAMLNMMHRIPFCKGDLLLIPSGVIHAMGGGATFIEFHEPCDYTLRFETDYMGQVISQKELHSGLGAEQLMEAVDFTACSYKEMEQLVKQRPGPRHSFPGGTVEELLSYDRNPYFKVDRAVIRSSMKFKQSRDSHSIMITAKGMVTMKNRLGEKKVKQGRGIVIPASAGEITVMGEMAELLIGYPFRMKGEVSYGLFT